MANHELDLRRVLAILRENKLVVDPRKSNMFVREARFAVTSCAKVDEAQPPSKLLSIQKWKTPPQSQPFAAS